MPELQSVLALVVTALAVMGSPGPSTVSITAVGGAFGVRKSIPYLWGLVIGTMAVLLAVAVGLTAARLSIPNVAVVLTTASIAYIVYLAYRIATAPPLAEIDSAVAAPSLWGGVALGVANPKAYVAIAAVFAANRLSDDATLDAIEKTIALTALIVLIHVVWLLAGAVFAALLRDPVRSRIVNIVLAIAVVVFSLLALLPH
jgi:threonine/homoserine/homoserine lactone efflux protein